MQDWDQRPHPGKFPCPGVKLWPHILGASQKTVKDNAFHPGLYISITWGILTSPPASVHLGGAGHMHAKLSHVIPTHAQAEKQHIDQNFASCPGKDPALKPQKLHCLQALG